MNEKQNENFFCFNSFIPPRRRKIPEGNIVISDLPYGRNPSPPLWGPRDIMILAITYTLLPKIELVQEELVDIADRLVQSLPIYYKRIDKKGYKDINYDIVCLTVGLHLDASRPHIHIGHLINTNSDKEIKNWDKSLRPLLLEFINIYKEKIDIKISFNSKVEETDRMAVLAYPLKEYKKYNDIILRKQFINLSDQEIEDLRVFAHKKWLEVLHGKQKKAKDKQAKEDSLENKWLYLDEKIQIHQEFYTRNADDKLRMIMMWLLHYQKQQYEDKQVRSFRISGFKETALNYLYLKQIISENDVFYLMKF